MMRRPPSVSILVPTYNRQEVLVETLQGLLMQAYDAAEIIVYDQSPHHPVTVSSFLEKFSHRIRLIRGVPRGLVPAYRRCVESARGEICFFVDDDVHIFDPHLVAKHAGRYADPSIGAVTGQVLHEGQEQPRPVDPRACGRYGWMHVRFDVAAAVEDLPSLCGANMSFRRRVYWEVGGFDPNFRNSGFRFETDFTFAVKAAGYRVVFDPDAGLVHRYGQPGGARNRHLFSLGSDAHIWYIDFFSNTWYFLKKWYTLPVAARLMASVWREHVFNRPAFQQGARFLLKRHGALIKGIAAGQRRRISR